MLILFTSKERFNISISGKVPRDYVKVVRYQDIGFNDKIILGKE